MNFIKYNNIVIHVIDILILVDIGKNNNNFLIFISKYYILLCKYKYF